MCYVSVTYFRIKVYIEVVFITYRYIYVYYLPCIGLYRFSYLQKMSLLEHYTHFLFTEGTLYNDFYHVTIIIVYC